MSYAPQSSPGLRALPACAALVFLLLTHSLVAQEVSEISTATRLLKEPDGTVLVSLPAGTPVEPIRTRGAWREVLLEGWIFTSSTEPTRRDSFDLVVTTAEGENIRQSPNGQVIGKVRAGTLLLKQEVRGGWTRVRRAGWIPRSAVSSAADPPVETGSINVEPPPTQAPAVSPHAPAPPPQAPTISSPARAQVDADRAEVARETAVFASPETGQYGTLQAGAPARVLGRSGDWARVRLEGWVHEADLKGGPAGALIGITAAEVRADPAHYVGRTVDWRLELIAVQTADELRPEIPLGQKYLLTRGPLPEPGFVYVMVSESQAAQFLAMQALQEMTLRVTIKAPKTRFLATPVVQLVSTVPEEAGS